MSDFNVRAEILSKIAETRDDTLRTILLLLLGVLDEIGSKIDNVMKDDATIKKLVLEHHAESHAGHHDYLNGKIINDPRIQQMIARALPALEWAEAKQIEERQLAKDNKGSLRHIIETLIAQAVPMLIAATLAGLAVKGWF